MGIIYKTTNKINGKVYIGQTIQTLNARKRGHLWEAFEKKDNSKFNRALRKYGAENFSWHIICIVVEKELNSLEIKNITLNNSYYSGYNSTEGGDINPMKYKEISEKISGKNHPMYGKTHTVEAKNKMSRARRGKGNPMYGKVHSTETKLKISKANRGKIVSLETKQRISVSMKENPPFKGKRHSAASKKKISKSKMGTKWSKETRIKQIKARKGKKLSEEHRQRISEGNGGYEFCVYSQNKLVGVWCNQNKCARELGLTTSLINRCLMGKQKSHKGYVFIKKVSNE
jgi:group I intron endonuclease